jgi:uncharacterized protein (UPF0332 family)
MFNTYEQFEFAKFLSLAKRLVKSDMEEEIARTITSRAYYAAFHAALIFLAKRDQPLVRGRAGNRPEYFTKHESVWNTFISSPNKDWKDIGAKGDRLKRSRHQADYDSHVSKVNAAAEAAILQAELIITRIASL